MSIRTRGATARAAGAPQSLFTPDGESASRFLSKDDCQHLGERVTKMAGAGLTALYVESKWRGNFRWARNEVATSGDVQITQTQITRNVLGAGGSSGTNALDDAALKSAVTRAEALVPWKRQAPEMYPVAYAEKAKVVHPMASPKIWFDSTYNLSSEARAQVMEPIVTEAKKLGLLSSGYIEIGGQGNAVIRNGLDTIFRYYPFTTSQFSLTIRDTRGTASGWAGIDFADWGRINPAELARTAIDKCVQSRNPVAVEPGRFTTILEPQAVCDLFSLVMGNPMNRMSAERGAGPFASSRRGSSKIGEKVFDERITISADPADPDLGFVPFDMNGEPYVPVKWFDRGVLKELSYSRYYGVAYLQKDQSLSNSIAFKMSGGTATREEMIASTERGVLVTRFDQVIGLDDNSLLSSGVTRDGLWLIEKGKISKAIKNFRFTESPMFVFNRIDQIGAEKRVFRPFSPVVCPIIKVRDFSFTGLTDAV